MSLKDTIDLRSDTVTKPCPAMRTAMANAEVGDDVYEEDPTVKQLESHIAMLAGKEASLFVPSGIMANQIALFGHTTPGDQVICGQGAHILRYEAGAASLISQIQLTQCQGDGTFTADDITGLFENGFHNSPTSLVSFENTHNVGGGIVWEHEQFKKSLKCAKTLGLATHLDGARLWNASIASGHSIQSLCNGVDSVSLCLSKGLGAPIGSVLCGTNVFIEKARRTRKFLGGAMRQVGVLAAAGLFAIENNLKRLSDDHRRAAILAQELSNVEGFEVSTQKTHTNIVMVKLAQRLGTAEEFHKRAMDKGLLFWPFGPQTIRLVTHKDLSDDHTSKAIELLRGLST